MELKLPVFNSLLGLPMSSLHAPLPGSIAPSSFSTGLTRTQIGIVLFGLLAAVFLVWPIWRAGFPLEINRNEAWNAWFIDAAIKGTPLYPGRDELIVNNYPPLSFYIVGLGSLLTGDTIYAGRLIALISTVLTAIAVALCIRALGGSRPAAGFGAAWTLATISHFFTRYVAVNDPNLLALAAMGFALAFFLDRRSKGLSTTPAIACFVAAGFIKHNLIAMPLTALIWLALQDKREAVRATLTGAALSALGVAVCVSVYGANFIEQMLMPRQLSIGHMLSTAGKLQWVAPALLFWGVWAWPNRHEPAARFSALLLGISLVSGLVQASGAGVTFNAHFETVFATGIAVALAFEGIVNTGIARRFGTAAVQTAIIAVLAARLVASQQLEPYLTLTSPSFRDETRQNQVIMDRETGRIKAIPGPVSCSVMTVCYRAGKAFVYEEFWVPQLIATGKWTKEAVGRAIAARGIRFEEIDPRANREKKRLF